MHAVRSEGEVVPVHHRVAELTLVTGRMRVEEVEAPVVVGRGVVELEVLSYQLRVVCEPGRARARDEGR